MCEDGTYLRGRAIRAQSCKKLAETGHVATICRARSTMQIANVMNVPSNLQLACIYADRKEIIECCPITTTVQGHRILQPRDKPIKEMSDQPAVQRWMPACS